METTIAPENVQHIEVGTGYPVSDDLLKMNFDIFNDPIIITICIVIPVLVVAAIGTLGYLIGSWIF